jgi:hypothetical protein
MKGLTLDENSVFYANQSREGVLGARDELERFVRDFVKHLIQKDVANGGLDVFCRVDIGIYQKSPDVVSYFVNEVERGIAASLWVRGGTQLAGLVGSTLVKPLKRWIVAEKKRLGITN